MVENIRKCLIKEDQNSARRIRSLY